MAAYTVAIIAAGGQARVHASGYAANDATSVVAVADPDVRAREAFCADFGIAEGYDDFDDMLEAVRPDIVSVCTPPALHRSAVMAAVRSGARAVHCEKPVALSYADALAMADAAAAAGTQLSFNLQRRFDPVHRFARDAIAAGEIGDVLSLEGYCPNLLDWGSHIVDLLLFYRDDSAARWVTGQVDVTTDRYVFGAFVETSSLTEIVWEDGVRAVIATGREPATPVLHRQTPLGLIVQGTEGRIIANGSGCTVARFDGSISSFETPYTRDTGAWDHGIDPAIFAATESAIDDLVAAVAEQREPALSARVAVAGAEVIFATYQSSVARARVYLPLDRDATTLPQGVDLGYWRPSGRLVSNY